MARLDENTRSAVHFLMIGAVILLALRGLGLVLELLFNQFHPDGHLLGPWRNGYLIFRPGAVTRAHTTLTERLALGFLLSTAVGSVGWALTWALRSAFGSHGAHAPLVAGRWLGGLSLAWCVVSAFLLPPETTFPDHITRDWRTVRRSTMIGELTLPWGDRDDRVAFTVVDGLGTDLRNRPDVHCRTVVRLWVAAQHDTTIIGTASPIDCGRTDALMEQGAEAAQALHALMHEGTGPLPWRNVPE
ncbi:MAG: hypothetical protein H6595_08710 [Flavobacteriales bacterium]|nr:hypothetical protein [Flavobacteriales bacterium]